MTLDVIAPGNTHACQKCGAELAPYVTAAIVAVRQSSSSGFVVCLACAIEIMAARAAFAKSAALNRDDAELFRRHGWPEVEFRRCRDPSM